MEIHLAGNIDEDIINEIKSYSSLNDKIINLGYYFTGAESSITTSFLYVLVVLHMTHLIAGIIVLFFVLFKKHFLQSARYSPFSPNIIVSLFLDALYV